MSFLTSYDDKVIKGIEEYIDKLKNPNAQELKKLKKALQDYIHKLLYDQDTIDSINTKIKGALGSDVSVKILTAILEYIQENKVISTTIAEMIKQSLQSFINDSHRLAVTERWIKNKIVNIVGDYSDEIAGFIEGTIKSWNAQEISQKLELEVGKDLQFIRINGMVVGGIIGGVIYGIERLFS
ncbi:Predicted membrane protein [Helicobacter pametensis]|nr:Predicted membrane protein [Helicobacter pametensis]